MARDGYKIRNATGTYFITFAVLEWVDVFTRKDYRDILVENLTYCQKEKGLIIYPPTSPSLAGGGWWARAQLGLVIWA